MTQIKRAKAITLTLLLAALTSANGAPSPQSRPATMTGTQLVQDMLADPFVDDANFVRRERAMGYIDGVMDSSTGLRWCPAGRFVPHELNYDV